MTIRFLIKALSEQDKVYIGGLGQFTKQHQVARICNDKILPPSNIVTFDPNSRGDELIFLQFVAQNGNMLLSEASIEIEKWVNELKNALNNNKSINFEEFGTFAKDENGIIGFESDFIPALNIEFEGMGTINNLQLTISNEMSDVRGQRSDIRSEELNENENNEELGVRNEELNENQEKEQEKEQKQEPSQSHSHSHRHSHSHSKKHKHKHRRHTSGKKVGIIIMIIMLLLALAACALYLFRYEVKDLIKMYRPDIQTPITEAVIVDTLVMEEVPSTDTTDIIIEEEEEATSVAEEETLSQDSKTDLGKSNISSTENSINQYETRYVNYESGKHYVIVGSFPSEKDVDRHIRDKQLKRFNPKIVKQAGVSNLRICIGIFDSEAEAENFGRNSKQNYWILN